MSQTITLTIVKAVVFDSVKSETYIRGQVEKAADPKALIAAYHEQAGDEAYQERLLSRGLYTAIEDLKTQIADYLSTDGETAGDNFFNSNASGENIVISLVVSDRFNKAFTQSLARLTSKYIEESMLMDWWKPINEKQSMLYAQFVERDLIAIRRCFNKTAPSAPKNPYTTKIETTGTAIEVGIGQAETITYILSDGAVDDVECRTEDTSVVSVRRCKKGFLVEGVSYGHTYINMYSRHNTDIKKVIHVFVTDQS